MPFAGLYTTRDANFYNLCVYIRYMGIDEYEVADGYECPTCDNVVNTSLGLKQHHAKVHDESLVEYTECQWCGDEFHVKPSQLGHFCSRECQMERRKSEGLEARKRRVTLVCETCGDAFEVPQSSADVRTHCSMDCYRADSNGKVLQCEQCGDEFYRWSRPSASGLDPAVLHNAPRNLISLCTPCHLGEAHQ